ncbi:MAG: hypothetical protein DLM58_03435 [Pseudonocardiales bacterium]|nr:MAG: hypothetical protein DLM58_03435 [Pseudonocardiales bacterium]
MAEASIRARAVRLGLTAVWMSVEAQAVAPVLLRSGPLEWARTERRDDLAGRRFESAVLLMAIEI